MGNIFFVMQAMEELVRKNALYYDVMCFSWTFADSSSSRTCRRKELLANYISEDVVQSVKGKILGHLSPELQRVLIVMAYIPHNALEVSVLRRLLQETGMEFTEDELIRVLDVGVREGMLLRSSENTTFVFAHDRIRQASKECIEGDDRDALLLRLAHVLLTLHHTTPAEED
jgi:predicted ATPase